MPDILMFSLAECRKEKAAPDVGFSPDSVSFAAFSFPPDKKIGPSERASFPERFPDQQTMPLIHDAGIRYS
jgi:hypothetical protein